MVTVRRLPQAQQFDGTLLKIMMDLGKYGIECRISSTTGASIFKMEAIILVAYDGPTLVGVLVYDKTTRALARLCAKTPEIESSLLANLGKLNPAVRIGALGTPTFRSPPAYTGENDEDHERQIRTQLKLPRRAIEDKPAERVANLRAKSPGVKSAFFKGGKTRRRLHKRARKTRKWTY